VIDNLFIADVYENVTDILAMTMQSLLKEDTLQKLTYKLASELNRTFTVTKDVTEEEKQAEERKIAGTSESILRTVIDRAIEDKFDFNGKGQQTQTNQRIATLRENSMSYIAKAEVDLDRLRERITSNEDVNPLIRTIIEDTKSFQNDSNDINFQARGSSLSSTSKNAIIECCKGIALQSQSYVSKFAPAEDSKHPSLPELARTLKRIETCSPHLVTIQLTLGNIQKSIIHSEITLKTIEDAEIELFNIERCLKELNNENTLNIAVLEIQAETKRIAELLVAIKEAYLAYAFRSKELGTGADIQTIAYLKTQSLNNKTTPPELIQIIAALRNEIRTSFPNRSSMTMLLELNRQLDIIANANSIVQINHAKMEFAKLLNTITDNSMRTHVVSERGKLRAASSNIQKTIQETRLLDPFFKTEIENTLLATIHEIQVELKNLKAWIQEHIHPVPYLQYNFIDMSGFQDWATRLVYGRVRERVDGLFSFVRREEIWRYGLLHHQFLIPYKMAMSKRQS